MQAVSLGLTAKFLADFGFSGCCGGDFEICAASAEGGSSSHSRGRVAELVDLGLGLLAHFRGFLCPKAAHEALLEDEVGCGVALDCPAVNVVEDVALSETGQHPFLPSHSACPGPSRLRHVDRTMLDNIKDILA